MLLDRDGPKVDPWRRPDSPDFATATHRLSPWLNVAEAPDAQTAGARGVEIANTLDVAALAPHFAALSLIAIVFPAFSDGRGLSQARSLRRLGYAGALRAVGPLIPDQARDLAACGFDEVELPPASAARQSPEQWAQARVACAAAYRRDYEIALMSIMEARRAAAARELRASHD